MVFLSPIKPLSKGFTFLLALFLLSSTCMWLNPSNAGNAQLWYAHAWGQEFFCSHSSKTAAADRLYSRGVHTTTSHWFSQGMLFEIEEDWDTFLALIPNHTQSNLFQLHSNMGAPRAPHQSYLSRRLYLHYLAFLC